MVLQKWDMVLNFQIGFLAIVRKGPLQNVVTKLFFRLHIAINPVGLSWQGHRNSEGRVVVGFLVYTEDVKKN